MKYEDVVRVLDKPISRELLTSANLMRLAYTGHDGYAGA